MELILSPTTADVQRAARSILRGNLVVFPTETVYGLGADACNPDAIKRLFNLKSRPSSNPLIVHLPSTKNISHWAKELPDYAQTLAKTFWPGPMTLVLNRNTGVHDLITGRQSTVGVRVPSNSFAQDLLLEFENIGGFGIAAPSANKYGKVSTTSATAAQDIFNDEGIEGDLILNGGVSEYGIESTIISCVESKPTILRPGVITPELIEAYTGIVIDTIQHFSDIQVPGMSLKHYAPEAKVVINHIPKEGQGLIADLKFPTPSGVIRISAPKNLYEFAKNLYESFKTADALNLKVVSVYLPEGSSGLATAIKDRVIRAAN